MFLLHRCLLPIFLVLLFANLKAQTILTSITGATPCPGDSITAVVSVSQFNSVASMSLSLRYDTNSAAYGRYTDKHPQLSSGAFLINDIGGAIKVAWFSVTPISIGTGTLFKLRFLYIGGYGRLEWDTLSPGACQYGDASGTDIPGIFTSANLAAHGSIIHHPVSQSIMAGDTAIFQIQAFGNTQAYKWQENSGSGWNNVFNGPLYSGANGPILKLTGPPLAFDGYQYRCRTASTCPSPNQYFYSDTALLNVSPPCQAAIAWAGNDTSIFAGQNLPLNAVAQHYQTLQWSGGDGIFSQQGILHPVYYPGASDILQGNVQITLIAFGFPPCANDTHSLSLSILPVPVNHPPEFRLNGMANDTFVFVSLFGQDSLFCFDLYDPDGDPVSVEQVLPLSLSGQIHLPGNQPHCLQYFPAPLFLGTDSFRLIACDTNGGCDTAWCYIQVSLPPYNLPPLALQQGLPADTLELLVQMNLGTSICLTLFDPENQLCDVDSASGARHGQLSQFGLGDSCFHYLSDTNYQGYDTLVLHLCDQGGACDSIVMILQVLNLNIPYPPQAAVDYCNGIENQTLVCSVMGNDFDINMDLDTASLEVISPPVFASVFVDTVSGQIVLYPDPYYNGPDTLQYRICDQSSLCDTALVFVYIAPVFDPPLNDTYVLFEDSISYLNILENDIFPYQTVDTASLFLASQPQNGNAQLDFASGSIVYTPAQDFYGEDSLDYRICDDQGHCGTARVYLSILPLNDAPRVSRVNGIPVSLPWPAYQPYTCSGKPLFLNITLFDPEGDSAWIYGVTALHPLAGLNLLNDSMLHYFPPPAFLGEDEVLLHLTDGLDSNTFKLEIKVHFPPFVNAGPNQAVCAGSAFTPVQAQAHFSNSFRWTTMGSGFFLNDTLLHPTYIPSNLDIQQGVVKLQITAYGNDSCGSHSDQMLLTFLDLPHIDLGSDTILCENYSITLDAGPGYVSYLWSDGSNGRYLSLDTSRLPAPGGVVGVSITDASSCSNDDQIVISFVPCPGIAESKLDAAFNIYPNPATDRLYVSIDIPNTDKAVATIVDMTGRIWVEQEYTLLDYSQILELDINHLPSGIYLISIRNPKFHFRSRFVKWHRM